MNVGALPNVGTLSIEQAAAQRAVALYTAQHTDLSQLTRYAMGKKDSIDLDRIQSRVKEIRKLNAQIECKKEEALKSSERCLSNKGISPVTWTIFGIQLIAFIFLGASAIYDLVTNDDPDQKGKNIAETVVSLVALLITSVVATILKGISDDNTTFKLFAEISKIEEQGESHYNDFLKALKDYKEDQAKEKLTQCIEEFDQIPVDNFAKTIPREVWLSRLIQMMPDDHPIKEKFRALERAATQIFDNDIPQTSNAKTREQESSSIFVSASEDSDEDKQFQGESLSMMDFSQKAETTSPLKKNRSLDSKTKSNFKDDWKSLENELGVKIDILNFKDVKLNRDAEVIKIDTSPEETSISIPVQDQEQ